MKLELAILAGAESKQFLVDFAKLLDRAEGIMGTKVIKDNDLAETAANLHVNDDFNEAAEPAQDADDDFGAPPPPKATKAKKPKGPTLDDVNDALLKKVNALGGGKANRDKCVNVLKKYWDVTSTNDLKDTDYAAVIEKMKV